MEMKNPVTEFTSQKKERFLERLAETGNVAKACDYVNTSRRTAYNHKNNDIEFAAAWEDAIESYIIRLEQEADRRATQGLVKKKFLSNGEPVIDPATGRQYEEREYSDTLLIFRLKALKPEKYRDNVAVKQEISGPGGGPVALTAIKAEELEKLDERELAKLHKDALCQSNQAQLKP